MEHPLDIAALADFNLVVIHGGFGSASRASGQPKATLSRRVRSLEEGLGVRLVERGGHKLRLTPEGEVLHRKQRLRWLEGGSNPAERQAPIGH